MAIDPSIPLGVRTAQFNLGDLFSTMSAVQQLRAQSQQARYNGLRLQEQEEEQRDRDAINAVIPRHLDADGQPDYLGAAAELEASKMGRAGQTLRKFHDERVKAQIEQAKGSLELQAKQYETMDAQFGLAYSVLSGVKKDPSTYPAARVTIAKLLPGLADRIPAQYDPAFVDQALTFGANTRLGLQIRKQEAEDVAANGLALENSGKRMEFYTKRLGTSLMLAPTVDERQAAVERLRSLKIPEGEAIIAQFGDLSSPDLPARAKMFAIGAEKVADDARQDAAAKETARHNRVTEGLSAATNAREQAKFNATYGSGVGEDGKPLPQNPLAKAIAEYRVPPPSARSLASGPGQALMAQVMQLNPDYHGEEFQLRSGTRKAFTSGAQGQTLNSLNTAIEHLDQFVDAAKALDNGSFKPGNAVFNAVREAFGSSAPTNFKGIKTIMAGELASAFKKSGATDTEIKNVEESVNGANSTQQLVDYATKVAIPALGSKANAFRDQYRSVMGEKDPWSALSTSSRTVLSKYGYDPEHPTMGGAKPPAAPAGGTVKMQAPDGSTQSVPASQVEHYKRLGAKVIR